MDKNFIVICSGNNKKLKRGKHYKVVQIRSEMWIQKYTIEGVKGEFDETEFSKKEFQASSKEWPRVNRALIINVDLGSTKKEVEITPIKVIPIQDAVTLFTIETNSTRYSLKVIVE